MGRKRVVVITGAGISVESGLSPYRGAGGLWDQRNQLEVASFRGWRKDRKKVLDYWNKRKRIIEDAMPNAAHEALAILEAHFEVTIITQNIDDLHEKAGSSDVIHLHGLITRARSSLDEHLCYDWSGKDIRLGDRCARGSQLRPDVVWIFERVPRFNEAAKIVKSADVLVVIGTSLQVVPASLLLERCVPGTPTFVVDPAIRNVSGYKLAERATVGVPWVVEKILRQY